MLKRIDLKKEVGSLDMLIRALSAELVKESCPDPRDESSARLIAEMREALERLRQARSLRKMWLTALECHSASESRNDIGNGRPAAGPGASAIY
ncbi:MAG TPA: hypothetical protein VNO14_18610 [Blastocatellia bacterium]|nr:hypothetical protein [Blastocatellia bacterium]